VDERKWGLLAPAPGTWGVMVGRVMVVCINGRDRREWEGGREDKIEMGKRRKGCDYGPACSKFEPLKYSGFSSR
jgi:hypothetical protein